MSLDVLAPTEETTEPHVTGLTAADQVWLVSHGVDPTWSDDQIAVAELQEIIEIGSHRLNPGYDDEATRRVVAAREQFFAFAGVDKKVVDSLKKRQPSLIPTSTFINNQRMMTMLGLDASKVAPEYARAFLLDAETIKSKWDDLTALGLDATTVISGNWNVLHYATEAFTHKVRLIHLGSKLLGWQYSAKELIEVYPSLLGFSAQKLSILLRIAAENITEQSRTMTPKEVKSMLITPLEKYILALAETDETAGALLDGSELYRRARRVELSVPDRKEQTLNAALSGKLGRVGTMYLQYRGVTSPKSAVVAAAQPAEMPTNEAIADHLGWSIEEVEAAITPDMLEGITTRNIDKFICHS